MSRTVAWFVHASAILAGGTGLVWAWMRYLCEPADEFALTNHPLEPETKALHVVFAPALLFAVGMLWRTHVWGRIRNGHRPRRATGVALAALFVPMAASGYLLQTAVDETWREVWVWVHVATGIAWALGYAVHQLASRGERRAPRT